MRLPCSCEALEIVEFGSMRTLAHATLSEWSSNTLTGAHAPFRPS
jgi:hypothetical protein